ncbi:hypothetical protein CPB85DRAFT_1292093 [Mucidula mucida]|nr:hypothetical protein CPB85DRAFT_1292093 [Mucidula mucida]
MYIIQVWEINYIKSTLPSTSAIVRVSASTTSVVRIGILGRRRRCLTVSTIILLSTIPTTACSVSVPVITTAICSLPICLRLPPSWWATRITAIPPATAIVTSAVITATVTTTRVISPVVRLWRWSASWCATSRRPTRRWIAITTPAI